MTGDVTLKEATEKAARENPYKNTPKSDVKILRWGWPSGKSKNKKDKDKDDDSKDD